MCYFDVQSKTWKLSSVQKLPDVLECYCAELIGNYLYVAVCFSLYCSGICCYDIARDTWSKLPPIPGTSLGFCSLCHIEDHLYVICTSGTSYRYHVATNQWQAVASLKDVCDLSQGTFCNKSVCAVYKTCLYVLHSQGKNMGKGSKKWYNFHSLVSVLYCFDPKKNIWEQKASTKTPHFGSSLLVVNNKLYVLGGCCSIQTSSSEPHGSPAGGPAAIEVYNDQENAWSLVKQTHIPPNNLGAVEINGRVYFIVNSFSVDSGITIPPGEIYPAVLDGWENLGMIDRDAVLCYVPLKTENLTTEEMFVQKKI